MRRSRGFIRLWRGIQSSRGSLRLHVIVSVVSMLLPVFILAGVGYLLVRRMVAASETVAKETIQELSALVDAQSALQETSAALYAYRATNDAPTRDRFTRALRAADPLMQNLRTTRLSEKEGVYLPIIAEAWQQIHAVTAVLVDPRHPLTKAEGRIANERYHDLEARIAQSLARTHGLRPDRNHRGSDGGAGNDGKSRAHCTRKQKASSSESVALRDGAGAELRVGGCSAAGGCALPAPGMVVCSLSVPAAKSRVVTGL